MASHELTYGDVQRILALLDGWQTGRAEMTLGDLQVTAVLAPAGAIAVISAPAIGMFEPAAPLSVGDRVTAGARLGVIDSAGTSTPVIAGEAGRIKRVCVQAGTFVEYGARLFELAGGEGVYGEGYDLHRRGG